MAQTLSLVMNSTLLMQGLSSDQLGTNANALSSQISAVIGNIGANLVNSADPATARLIEQMKNTLG